MSAIEVLPGPHALTGERALRHAARWTDALRGVASVRHLPAPDTPADHDLRLLAGMLGGDRLLDLPVPLPLPDTSAIRADADRMLARYGRDGDGARHAHIGDDTLAEVRGWDLPALVATATGLRVSPRLRLYFARDDVDGVGFRLDSRRFGDLRLVVPLDPAGTTLIAGPGGVRGYRGPVLFDGVCVPHGRAPDTSARTLNIGLRRLGPHRSPDSAGLHRMRCASS
ncbi:hypothetical protein ABZ816_21335 [Actinosynnema sp. NPDC047251]|uniref:Uncharacterized protein n=1 Tax=Saccharothrix espanaensis (strain ATCC 51144 / DSM 44229 / JCM 9112 / NBRC 15066 / NRRL 15764) TaxID=1179773 RepID=K0KED4_SACES|nr:hypothetical protein [Saccharothrix espanaensis]CCH35109.1 hypothetical protein BN6_78910 [Saccharothrix espanaensis DSM 44229]